MRFLLFVICLAVSSSAFVPPSSRVRSVTTTTKKNGAGSTASALNVGNVVVAGASVQEALSGAGSLLAATPQSLMDTFLETLIAWGVPTLLSVFVILLFAKKFGGDAKARSERQDDLLQSSNPVAQLYKDLYGDQKSVGNKNTPFGFGGLGMRPEKTKLPRNVGVPATEFIKVTHLNRQLDSYKYSVQAATRSKAAAAADFRQTSFVRALGKALDGGVVGEPSVRKSLLEAEKEFLKDGAEISSEIAQIQAELTQDVVDEELAGTFKMDSAYDLDAAYNVTATNNTSNETTVVAKKTKTSRHTAKLTELGKLQRELQESELDFIQTIVKAVGPAYGTSVRTALLGDVAVRGSGGLLRALQDRPLKVLLDGRHQADGGVSAAPTPGNVFVARFPGDATASQVATLREEATAIIRSANSGVDEVLVVLQTGGGTVTGYGLAAAQLQRFKEAGLKLTIAVEQVAASGGYMMCCVADRIVASPFAVLGSIGVISDIPNIYDRLKKEGIEFQTVTAGKYKRTLTPTKKVTKEDFEKSKQDIEEVLVLFRDFVAQNRPQLDIDNVATGETWFGTAALDRKLCDEIKTVDDVLMDYVDSGHQVFEVKYEPPIDFPFGELAFGGASTSIDTAEASWLRRAVRWVVRTIASEVRAEMKRGQSIPIEQRYMAEDNTATRIKSD